MAPNVGEEQILSRSLVSVSIDDSHFSWQKMELIESTDQLAAEDVPNVHYIIECGLIEWTNDVCSIFPLQRSRCGPRDSRAVNRQPLGSIPSFPAVAKCRMQC